MPADPRIFIGSREAFARVFASAVPTLPRNVALAGKMAGSSSWFVAPPSMPQDPVFMSRVPPTLRFLQSHVLPRLPARSLWFPLCFWDGWRERTPYAADYRWVPPGDLDDQDEWRGGAGELPQLSPDRRRVACFGAHRGDPSALLLPEAHYVARDHYAQMFAEIRGADVPWHLRASRAVYCGGDHGETTNVYPPFVAGRPHPRRYLREVVAASGLDVDVHLGEAVPHATQMGCKWILDVDGYTRTWDAWAWKLMSGSVMLATDSPWETLFTRLFDPWHHYVPVANDFSDLEARLQWCRDHDDDCRRIAQRARERAEIAYATEFVASIVAGQFNSRQ